MMTLKLRDRPRPAGPADAGCSVSGL